MRPYFTRATLYVNWRAGRPACRRQAFQSPVSLLFYHKAAQKTIGLSARWFDQSQPLPICASRPFPPLYLPRPVSVPILIFSSS